jgi:hypothetical protein
LPVGLIPLSTRLGAGRLVSSLIMFSIQSVQDAAAYSESSSRS